MTLRNFGTVRFDAGVPTRFDGSTAVRALGVGIHKTTQQAIRFRYQAYQTSGQGALSLSAVVNGQTRYLGTPLGNTVDDEVPEIVQLGRSITGDRGFVVLAMNWGVLPLPTLTNELRERLIPQPVVRCGQQDRRRTLRVVASPGERYFEVCEGIGTDAPRAIVKPPDGNPQFDRPPLAGGSRRTDPRHPGSRRRPRDPRGDDAPLRGVRARLSCSGEYR